MRTLVFLAFAALAVASQRQIWNEPMAPFLVIGNLYSVGTAGLGCYLIATPAGHILIDGGLPESAPLIEKHIDELGLHLRDVKFLLNTHAHYDHSGGLSALKRVSGAQLLASEGDAPDLERGHTSSYGAGWDVTMAPVHVDRIIRDGEQIRLGGSVVTAHLTPGHTKGCTTWSMPVTAAGRTYQVVFYCSTSVPGYPLLHNREYPNIVSDYEHSFQVLAAMPCDVFLSNHTGFCRLREKRSQMRTGRMNPFIDSGEMARYVAESKRQFEDELHAQAARAH